VGIKTSRQHEQEIRALALAAKKSGLNNWALAAREWRPMKIYLIT